MKKVLCVIFIALLTIGCGADRLDGTSEKTLKASMKEVSDGMSKEEKDEFAKAVLKVGFVLSLEGWSMIHVRKQLHDKTADEVIEYSKELQKEYNKKRRK